MWYDPCATLNLTQNLDLVILCLCDFLLQFAAVGENLTYLPENVEGKNYMQGWRKIHF